LLSNHSQTLKLQVEVQAKTLRVPVVVPVFLSVELLQVLVVPEVILVVQEAHMVLVVPAVLAVELHQVLVVPEVILVVQEAHMVVVQQAAPPIARPVMRLRRRLKDFKEWFA
jgi:hypothetical protein